MFSALHTPSNCVFLRRKFAIVLQKVFVIIIRTVNSPVGNCVHSLGVGRVHMVHRVPFPEQPLPSLVVGRGAFPVAFHAALTRPLRGACGENSEGVGRGASAGQSLLPGRSGSLLLRLAAASAASGESYPYLYIEGGRGGGGGGGEKRGSGEEGERGEREMREWEGGERGGREK